MQSQEGSEGVVGQEPGLGKGQDAAGEKVELNGAGLEGDEDEGDDWQEVGQNDHRAASHLRAAHLAATLFKVREEERVSFDEANPYGCGLTSNKRTLIVRWRMAALIIGMM